MTQFVFVIWQSDDICWALFVLAWCSCTPVLSFCFVKHFWKKNASRYIYTSIQGKDLQANTCIHQYRGKNCKQYIYTSIQGKELQANTYIHQYRGKNCIASKYIYTSIQGKELNDVWKFVLHYYFSFCWI